MDYSLEYEMVEVHKVMQYYSLRENRSTSSTSSCSTLSDNEFILWFQPAATTNGLPCLSFR